MSPRGNYCSPSTISHSSFPSSAQEVALHPISPEQYNKRPSALTGPPRTVNWMQCENSWIMNTWGAGARQWEGWGAGAPPHLAGPCPWRRRRPVFVRLPPCFLRLPRLLWRALPPRAGALDAVGCVAARAWVWGLGVRHLDVCLLARPGTWVVGTHLRSLTLHCLTGHLACGCSGALGAGVALSMVMSMLCGIRRESRQEGPPLEPGRFGGRLHAHGVSFLGVRGPRSPMNFSSYWEVTEPRGQGMCRGRLTSLLPKSYPPEFNVQLVSEGEREDPGYYGCHRNSQFSGVLQCWELRDCTG